MDKAWEVMNGLDRVSFFAEIVAQTFPAVLVFVAVDAEILPVGAVRGVIPGIPVLVVHRQKLPVAMGKFPPAFGANQPVDSQ
jgi:hypothetical protein